MQERRTRNLSSLQKEQSIKNANHAIFGFKNRKAAIIWYADAGITSAINADRNILMVVIVNPA